MAGGLELDDLLRSLPAQAILWFYDKAIPATYKAINQFLMPWLNHSWFLTVTPGSAEITAGNLAVVDMK